MSEFGFIKMIHLSREQLGSKSTWLMDEASLDNTPSVTKASNGHKITLRRRNGNVFATLRPKKAGLTDNLFMVRSKLVANDGAQVCF